MTEADLHALMPDCDGIEDCYFSEAGQLARDQAEARAN